MTEKFKKIIQAAEEGGKIVKKYFGQPLEIEEKSTAADFRTKADLESEKVILDILTTEFPDYNIHSEERGYIDKKSEFTFIIDPLDGSNNFVVGIPNFSVNIALSRNKKIIASVTHQPIINQTFYTKVGEGAFLGNQKLKVNQEPNIKKSSIVYTCGYNTSKKWQGEIKNRIENLNIKRSLNNWSPAFDFCLLASGKIEVIINDGNEIYDCAAGKLIAREAGALITDFKGNKDLDDTNRFFLASNGTKIHQEILKILTAT